MQGSPNVRPADAPADPRGRCLAYLEMDDPWYVVACILPRGHEGAHRTEWDDAAYGAGYYEDEARTRKGGIDDRR